MEDTSSRRSVIVVASSTIVIVFLGLLAIQKANPQVDHASKEANNQVAYPSKKADTQVAHTAKEANKPKPVQYDTGWDKNGNYSPPKTSNDAIRDRAMEAGHACASNVDVRNLATALSRRLPWEPSQEDLMELGNQAWVTWLKAHYRDRDVEEMTGDEYEVFSREWCMAFRERLITAFRGVNIDFTTRPK